MFDHVRPESPNRNSSRMGQCLRAITSATSASIPTRRAPIAVLALIGLLLSGLVLPASPFVKAGEGLGIGTPGGTPVAVEPPPDQQWVIFEPCTASPLDFNESMSVVSTAFLAPEPPSFSLGFEPEVRGGLGGGVTSYQLLDGTVPPASSVDSVVQLLGAELNCGSALQQVAYWTDDYLIRMSIDDEQGGRFVAALWRSANPEETPEPSGPAPVTDGDSSQIQAPSTPEDMYLSDRTGARAYQMYGFRMIDNTHLGAYVEIADNVSVAASTSPFEQVVPTFEQTGYAVFEQQSDGTWLIDGFESPETILRQRLFPEGSATPAA